MTATTPESCSGSALALVDRKVAVLKLKREGLGFAEIGRQLNITTMQASAAFYEALRALPERHATDIRTDILTRLELYREHVTDLLANPPPMVTMRGEVVRDDITGEVVIDQRVVLDTIKLLDHLDDRLAKMLGLYPAAKMQVDATVASYTLDTTTGMNLDALM